MLRFRHAALPAAVVLLAASLGARPAVAQVQVSIRPLAPPEAFYFADLLPGNPGLRPDLIAITLTGGGGGGGAAGRAPGIRGATTGGGGPTISLEVTVARESPSPIQIFDGSTDPFVLNVPVRRVTLRDLTSRGEDVSITHSSVNHDAVDVAGARGGRLPAGTYVFTAIVHDAGGDVIGQDELRLTFAAPSRVELLSPGAPAEMPPPDVPGPTPRFIWSAAGEASAARYRLRVVRVDGAASPMEALQTAYPAWDATVAGTSAIYPASVQALRLEPGATYAWQVTRELSTSGGTELVESPIYWFRVAGAGGQGASGGAVDLRFAALLRALGFGELEGFTPTGATLDDGRPLSLERLEQLLTAIQAGELALLSARVR